jgi:hypothetical protein
MASYGSIFGDHVKREYLSGQNFRLHFLLMIFEAGSLYLSNCILVLGYGEPSRCSYRLRSSRTTPAANTGWLTRQRGARGALVGRLVLDWISHAGLAFTLFSFRDHSYLLRLTRGFYMRTKLYTIFDFRIHSEFSSLAASRISLSKSSQEVTICQVSK